MLRRCVKNGYEFVSHMRREVRCEKNMERTEGREKA